MLLKFQNDRLNTFPSFDIKDLKTPENRRQIYDDYILMVEDYHHLFLMLVVFFRCVSFCIGSITNLIIVRHFDGMLLAAADPCQRLWL